MYQCQSKEDCVLPSGMTWADGTARCVLGTVSASPQFYKGSLAVIGQNDQIVGSQVPTGQDTYAKARHMVSLIWGPLLWVLGSGTL